MTQKDRVLELLIRRYRVAISSQVYGIVLLAEDDRIEFVNQVYCDMFGLSISPAELIDYSGALICVKERKGRYELVKH
jgi:PAS domain-containing protein